MKKYYSFPIYDSDLAILDQKINVTVELGWKLKEILHPKDKNTCPFVCVVLFERDE